MSKPFGPPTRPIRDAALSMLSRREYSRQELSMALARKGYLKEDITTVVDKMDSVDLQSDSRRAASLVRGATSKKRGVRRILADARYAGLSEDVINTALSNNPPDWLASANTLVRRKHGDPPYDRANQTKILNLLLRRGFSMEIARQVASAGSDSIEDTDP